jgi:hypothetical protein
MKEAILNDVPVSSANVPPCAECMAGLDVMARWELLTPKDEPISLPKNGDPGHHPPHQGGRVSQPKVWDEGDV